MEIKAELIYPYTEEVRAHFIVEQNHTKGYEIREVEREYEKVNIVEDYEEQEKVTPREIDDYDEYGLWIGSHIENVTTIERVITGTHEETVTVTVIDLQAWGYTEEEIEEQKHQQFLKDFFNTSLGYIRRKVSMKTGETKDFLADILPILQVGIPILTYTIDGEQNKVLVTEEFIDECKQQVIKDFYGV